MAGTGRAAAHAAFIALIAMLVASLPLRAATLLRDPDIEHALSELALPLITAAGLNPAQIKILVIKDRKLNAFVVDTRHVLVHSGLILKVKTAEELQAVIAHELAHIANGHITRRRVGIRNAGTTAGFGVLLSLALAAAGADPSAAVGVALGTASSAKRVFLAHTRAEEASADQAALRYMALRGIDPGAMSDVLAYFRGQEALSPAHRDPYVLSHPLTRDRIRAVKGYAAAYAGNTHPNPKANYWFARAQAKLSAFLRNPGWTLRRIDKNDNSDIAMLRRAIALHRIPDHEKAIAEIGRLVARRPGDPFLRDLQGQILLESRKYRAAVRAYGKAVSLAPGNALILAGYGRSLLQLKTADGDRRALKVLQKARLRDGRNAGMLRDLALSYARTGNRGMAAVATAERYALLGKMSDAAVQAKRAVGLLPRGSPGWNRAQDVLNAADAAK